MTERLTVKEYAERFRVHIQTVYAMIRNGTLPHRVERLADRAKAPIRIVLGEMPSSPPRVRRGVYFIRCGQFVKIGLASDLERRYRSLRVSLPFPIKLVGFIEVADGDSLTDAESEYHERYAELRHNGEWFREEGALASFCERMQGGPRIEEELDQRAS